MVKRDAFGPETKWRVTDTGARRAVEGTNADQGGIRRSRPTIALPGPCPLCDRALPRRVLGEEATETELDWTAVEHGSKRGRDWSTET